jgi:iron-regulated transporter 1
MRIGDAMERRQAYTLYLNHALSTWNARAYEFAAVLFTASAYPKGLRAASLIGISTSLAAILFGASIGRWIDHGSSRLKTLLATIGINRLAVAAACCLWFIIVGEGSATEDAVEVAQEHGGGLWLMIKPIAFSTLLLLGIAESLSRKANVISLERDWVPILAPVSTPTGYTLTHVNAMISRIDIVCKLAAPIAVSGFLSVVSTRVGVFTVFAMNGASFLAEVWSARKLWDQCPQLAVLKTKPNGEAQSPSSRTMFNFRTTSVYTFILGYLEGLYVYFDSDVWMPSVAMCVSHASVLSLTGVTVVFFLDSGYSLQLVTAAEALSTIFELGSTLLYPLAVRRVVSSTPAAGFVVVPQEDDEDDLHLAKGISNTQEAEAEGVDMAISRVGLSGIMSMATVLVCPPSPS